MAPGVAFDARVCSTGRGVMNVADDEARSHFWVSSVVGRCLGALAIWALVWWAPWRELFPALPWLRVAVALSVVLLPGVFWHRWQAEALGTRSAIVGPLWSLAAIGLLGLAACLSGVSIRFVDAALFAIGAIGLVAWLRRRRTTAGAAPDAGAGAELLPLLAAMLAAAWLVRAPSFNSDNLSYVAWQTTLAHRSHLGFDDFRFGGRQLSIRFWFAFWPLAQALIGNKAGVDGWPLSIYYLDPLLAAWAVLCVYGLARALGLSRPLAGWAAVTQVIALTMLLRGSQAGTAFVQRLNEDKALTAFALAPAWFTLVLAYLDAPGRGRWLAMGLGALALLLVHPPMFGVAGAVAAGLAVLDGLRSRRLAPALAVLGTVLTLAAIPLSFRFADQPYAHVLQFSADHARRHDLLAAQSARRLRLAPDGSFTLNPRLVDGAPFVMLAAAALVALPLLRRSAAARYVVAASAVLVAVYTTPGAALFGRALTAFQLWRVPWFAPFGIAAALLAETILRFTGEAAAARRRPLFVIAPLACLAIALLSVSTVPAALPVAPQQWADVLALKRPSGSACRPRYDELAGLGQALDRAIDGAALVVGDAALNDLLPTVSAKARVLVFRTAFHMRDAFGMPGAEVDRRMEAWAHVVGADVPPADRLRLLSELDVRLLAVCGEPEWLADLRRAAPDRVELHQRIGQLGLYRLLRPGSA